jgi:DNA-binding PadR family transcriptional regulator
MVLRPLASLGPSHGYAIAARLEQVSRGALQPNIGTLYPALMRLEQRGLLRGSWSTTENNRKAHLYALATAGRRQLGERETHGTRWPPSFTRCCAVRSEE